MFDSELDLKLVSEVVTRLLSYWVPYDENWVIKAKK